MAKKQHHHRNLPSPVANAQRRRAEAVTVAWMLTTLATFAAELLSLAAYVVLTYGNREVQWPAETRILPPLLLFIALITGSISLLLIPLVYQFRSIPPPGRVTAAAALIGAAPLVLLAALVVSM